MLLLVTETSSELSRMFGIRKPRLVSSQPAPSPSPSSSPSSQTFGTRYPLRTDAVVWRGLPVLEGTNLVTSGRRYGGWVQTLKGVATLPTEFILPRIEVPYRAELPASMQAAEARHATDPAAADAIAAEQWGYYFYLGGGKSTLDRFPKAREINRASSSLRMQMINEVIEDVVGAEKSDMSVLDFACNWGGMAIDMAHRGFRSVTAFDFKEDNIRRAGMLNAYMGTDVQLDVANAYDLPAHYQEGFDVVLNLGLLYHVTDPVRLVQLTHALTRKVAVFDTLCHKEPFSGFITAYLNEDQIKRSGMGEQQIELHPTYRGLVDLIHFAGFRNLVEVAPIIGPKYPDREKEHYYVGHRRTIIAFK
ncbi:class I SAM-dependent methyltransferase [Salipiger bermudensis]|uniref:class I SAM-dependent methyltransferase n=1 Tax=Salipiger bermudensis TaxID=344736 RepID=UPI001CD3D9F5|nr:class I SAM-dependent methyltransferase [Salipiger bermudensis]MCA0964722.1 class I SAM-dependent methyltransferase [Salipiger bermudensis]